MDLMTLTRIQASTSACALTTSHHRPPIQSRHRAPRCCASQVCSALTESAAHHTSVSSSSRVFGVSAWVHRNNTHSQAPGRRCGRAQRVVAAAAGSSSDRNDPARKLSLIEGIEHKRFLAKYVNEVDPSVVDTFPKSAPPHVTEAMRSAVSGLTGNLPPQFFDVSISTVGDNLKSIMFSFLMTGYLFRNVEHHLELKHGLERALPSPLFNDDGSTMRPGARYGLRSDEPDGYAPGANLSGIDGTVTRWRYSTGPEKVPASEYIDKLEKELADLKQQLQTKEAENQEGRNQLMDFLRSSPQSNIHDLRVSPEVSEAMQIFLKRLLGTSDSRELSEMTSTTSATEFSRLLFWLLIVGFTLRNMEVRFSMEQSYALPFVSLEDKGLTGDL